MIKVKADKNQRMAIRAITEVYRGEIVDMSADSMIIELTGDQNKLDAFMNLLVMDGYEILELARTGIAGLGRGTENVTYL